MRHPTGCGERCQSLSVPTSKDSHNGNNTKIGCYTVTWQGGMEHCFMSLSFIL